MDWTPVLREQNKLIAQIMVASMVVFLGYRLQWVESLTGDTIITIIWIVGITNAINLALIALLVWAFSFEILGAIISFLVSGSIVAIYGIVLLRRDFTIKLKFHKEILKSLLKLGILFSVTFFIIQTKKPPYICKMAL